MSNIDLRTVEEPKILNGDLLRCKETGALIIVREVQLSEEGRYSFSSQTLPNQPSVRCAWWSLGEVEIVEKSPAHKLWKGLVAEHIEKQNQKEMELDIQWLFDHWDEVKERLNTSHIRVILSHYDGLPDTTDLAMNGEIGMQAYVYLQMWRKYEDLFNKAMENKMSKDEFRVDMLGQAE